MSLVMRAACVGVGRELCSYNPIARKEDAVNPPANVDATFDEALIETDPSLDLFIESLTWDEPDRGPEEE
jgi:hypothetical protein